MDSPDKYKTSNGYYFTAASGTLYCGYTNNMWGCQSSKLVKNLPKCTNPDDNAPLVTMTADGKITTDCTSQGVFVPPKPVALEPGHSVVIQGATCFATKKHVECKINGKSFSASRNYFGPLK